VGPRQTAVSQGCGLKTALTARFVPAIIQWLGYDPLPRPRSLGEWIVIERTRRGLARRRLATALGWDEATLGEYEAGRAPDARRLAELCTLLGYPDRSLGQSERPPSKSQVSPPFRHQGSPHRFTTRPSKITRI
jgi:hypothetical protein